MYRQYRQEIQDQEMAGKSAQESLKIVLFMCSTREGRLGTRVAKFMQDQLEKTDHKVELFDPLELKFPLLEKPLHHYQDKTKAPKWLQDCEAKIIAADAFVVLSSEYNHSIPPALTNMMDHFGIDCYSYKPSAIVTYSPGIYGGMRAAMQLRAFLGEIGCISVSNIFGIPEVHLALDENGKPLNDKLEKGAKTIIGQLDWMAWAMKNHRAIEPVP